MRFIASIMVCKLLYFIGSRIGRGSSLPGRAALFICPDALKRISLPGTVIAVTGSNGKTSTAEMLAHSLKANGMSVGWNHEGANQIEGIATLLLRLADLRGVVRRDALVLECDERYTRHIFEHVQPSILVITNLCRDQLTRNGHPEFIQDCLRAAADTLSEQAKLVLNADDPYVAALAAQGVGRAGNCDQNLFFFGISQNAADAVALSHGVREPSQPLSPSADSGPEAPATLREAYGMYDDGAFCPVCKNRMEYDYRIAGHMGGYRCRACGHKRPAPQLEVTGLNYETGETILTGGIKTRLAFPGLTGAYNLTAAITAASAAGLKAEKTARALDGYALTGGRTLRFSAGARDGLLLVSKHENSMSYNQSLEWVVRQRRPCTVVIMVESISRKYYTSDTSWLWDVDFGILADDNVKNIVLTGKYCNELALRFLTTAVEQEKVSCLSDPETLREHVGSETKGEIFALTCFSDKEKLLRCFRGNT